MKVDNLEGQRSQCSCLPIQVGWLFSNRSHFKPYLHAGTYSNQSASCFYITEWLNCGDSDSWGQRSKRKKIIEPCSWSASTLRSATPCFQIFRERRQTHRSVPHLRPLPWAATDQTPSALVSRTWPEDTGRDNQADIGPQGFMFWLHGRVQSFSCLWPLRLTKDRNPPMLLPFATFLLQTFSEGTAAC